MNPDRMLTDHFRLSEFGCRCCGAVDEAEAERLACCLEELRTRLGLMRGVDTPIYITSSYRCERHNARVGGAEDSQHRRGKAADIHIPGVHLFHVVSHVETIPDFSGGGIGVYFTLAGVGWLHVDRRGTVARFAKLNKKDIDYSRAMLILRGIAMECGRIV